MLIELGGSTYPVPRHGIEMPKPGVLMNREMKENAKSISAAIAKSSEERPIMAGGIRQSAPCCDLHCYFGA